MMQLSKTQDFLLESQERVWYSADEQGFLLQFDYSSSICKVSACVKVCFAGVKKPLTHTEICGDQPNVSRSYVLECYEFGWGL